MLASAWDWAQDMAAGVKPTETAPPSNPQSMAAIVSDSVPTSSIPLLRLVYAVGRHARRHRVAYITAAAAAVALGVTLRHLDDIAHTTRDHRRRRPSIPRTGAMGTTQTKSAELEGNDDDDDGDIDFIDPAQSRFTAAWNKIKKTKEAPFFTVLKELEELVSARDGMTRGGDPAGVGEGEQQRYEDLKRSIDFKARQADELLTQYIVSLDGLPVGSRAELKAKRKALVTEAVALAERFSHYLPSQPSTTDAAGVSGEEPKANGGEEEGSEEWDRVSADQNLAEDPKPAADE